MKNIYDSNENYKSVRVLNGTYRQLKQLGLDLNMPITKLVDMLLDNYKKTKGDINHPQPPDNPH